MFRLWRKECASFPSTVSTLRIAAAGRSFSVRAALLQQQQPPPREFKLARALSMEVNKIKSQFRQSPSPTQRSACLDALSAVSLKHVQQLDVKTVVHILGALEELKAPSEHPIVREAAEWISMNGNSFSNLMQLAQALYSIASINKSVCLDLIATVQPRIMESMSEMDAPTASRLISVARAVGLSGEQHQVWQEQCIAVLRSNIPKTQPSDLVAMAEALHSHPNDTLLFTDVVRIAASSLKKLELSDSVRLVPLIATSHITQTDREDYLAAALNELEEIPLDQFTAGDAASLYDALRGFLTIDNPVAQRLIAFADKISLDSASIGEALVISSRLGVRTPPSIVATISNSVDTHFAEISNKPPAEIAALFTALAVCLPLQQLGLAMKLGDRVIKELKGSAVVTPHVLGALMTTPMVQMYGNDLHALTLANFEKWEYANTVTFITRVSKVQTLEARRILRDISQKVAQAVHNSTPYQLTALACAFGRAGVRNDVFCNAVAERCVKDHRALGPHGVSSCLGFLAAVDYRNNKCFVELQMHVRAIANVCGPNQVINFIASFAKVLLWNLKLFYPLVARASNLTEFFSIPQIVSLLISVERVDIRHPPLSSGIVKRLRQLAPTADAKSAVALLSGLSKYGITDLDLYNILGEKATAASSTLSAADLGELLVAFSRAGHLNHPIYSDNIMAVLATAPTATPIAIANLATAYSTVGLRHEELFEILAEKTLVLREECPSVLIANILCAFAKVGIRNDKLFIEMITRVRNVPAFGTPLDIVNVVTAYSLAGVWHLRLFTKLGERAMYLRGEFRGSLIAELLAGYARVEMKFDKLFAEFSPRIQACALTLTPSDLTSIVNSYASVMIPDAAVFEVVGDRLAANVHALTEEEKRIVMGAYNKAGITHNGLASALSGLPIGNA